MISIRKIIWLIALILLLLAIPFLVPSSLVPMDTDAEAEAYTLSRVLGGADGWLPG